MIFILVCTGAAVLPKAHLAQDALYRTEKRHFRDLNKKVGKGKNQKRFILVQEAVSGSIEEKTDQPGSYLLILNDISPYIQFYKAQPSKSFGIIFMKQYLWFCKIGKNAFLKSKRGALGYVSFSNSDSIFDTEVLELTSPKYIKKENKLLYDIQAVDSFNLQTIKMEKVTLIIDLALK